MQQGTKCSSSAPTVAFPLRTRLAGRTGGPLLSTIRRWRGRPRTSRITQGQSCDATNQDEINALLEQSGIHQPYCGSERLNQGEKPSCTVLPRLAVVAISPTMMAVQSYTSKQVDYLVTGIFWRSETGFDIAKAAD